MCGNNESKCCCASDCTQLTKEEQIEMINNELSKIKRKVCKLEKKLEELS